MNEKQVKQGVIKVRHYRFREGYAMPEWYTRGHGFVQLNGLEPRTFDRTTPTSKGGTTRAEVVIGTSTFFGWAYCSLSDAFCYALGSTIARGRLRKPLEAAGLGGTVQL